MGRGSSGKDGESTFKFGHAPHGHGDGRDTPDFPSRVNIHTRTASPEQTLEAFRRLHVNDRTESAFTVDEQGFVTQYVHGGATSVGIVGRRGEMVYHNHPSGGAFSDSDLISVSMTAAKGIVASGRNGDYIFQKSNGFKANEFVKAVRNAKMTGKTYDEAVDRWLTRNQKKFGYKYVFKKA